MPAVVDGPGAHDSAPANGLPPKDGPPSFAMEMEAPVPSGTTGMNLQAVNEVLYSDIGINTLLTRLKQSIASANDFSSFLKKRSALEREHADGLRKLSRSAHDSARSSDHRQGSYSRQLGSVTSAHERMADNGLQFANSLQQMHDDLNELANNTERGRKHWKHEGLSNEKKVKDAESLMDKAKSKYDASAESYDRVKTGDSKGGFGIKGPKSAEQREADLHTKMQAADADYKAKVDAAHSTRQDNINSLRPQAVRAIQELINECDNALTLQLQKYAAFSEKLLVANGLIISPMKTDSGAQGGITSMREMIQAIDNDKDFHTFITSHSGSVPPKPTDIKYERHPAMGGGPTSPVMASKPALQSTPQAQASPKAPTQPSTFGVRTPTSQVQTPTSASQPISQSASNPSQAPLQPQQQHMQPGGSAMSPARPMQQQPQGFRGPTIGAPTPAPSQALPAQPPQLYPTQQNQPPRSAFAAQQPAPGGRVPYQPPGPRNPSAGMQNGPNGTTMAPTNPVFGLSLDALFRRDDSAVPLVVYQCIQAVDLFGLEVEGIYRIPGNSSHIQQLKASFDHDSTKVDFRNPSAFHHDVNSVAGLLKQFLRELPDPLLTAEHYGEFIEAARIDDNILRRDSLHAIINNLPDPNYATLRALVLHLNRVQERSATNRMTTPNLAICFAPTIMGAHRGAQVTDSNLQTRALDTILQNTFQIFDED